MRRTTMRMLAGLMLLAGIPSFGQAPKKKTSALPDQPAGLDLYVNKVLKDFEVPGCSLVIVRDGKVILTKGYGVRRLGSPAPVDDRTLFLIASNSKAFTATALAMLVEEGKLKWEDPVIDHLPWWRMSDPYVTTHITVRDLLVHHSGIGAYAGDVLLFPPSTYSRQELVQKVKELPLVRGFRTDYAYDNILYLAAGEVIKAVSGMEWEDFIRTRIFDRLGMNGSISRFSSLKTAGNVAMAHTRLNGTVKTVGQFMSQDIGDAGDPAGGICSNAHDMANWLITQLDSGMAPNKTRLFHAASTRELWKVVTPMPIPRVPAELAPAQQSFWGYALGFRTYNYGAWQVVGHGGALTGFVSQIAMIPKLKLGIAVMTNQESTGAYWSIIYHLLDHYLGNPAHDWAGGYRHQLDSALKKLKLAQEKVLPHPAISSGPSLPISKYAGLYRDALYGDIRIDTDTFPGRSDIHLVLRFTRTPQLVADLEHYQNDSYVMRFRNRDLKSDAYINFALNADASIDQAKIQNMDPDSDMDFSDLLLKPVHISPVRPDTTGMRSAILEEIARHPDGVFAVAVKDLTTGITFFLNEHDRYHAASTMKTPVLIETFRQIAAHRLALTDSILVHRDFRSIADSSTFIIDSATDSESDLYTRTGSKVTLQDLLFRMITKSSNLATNIVIEMVGAPNVMTTMRSLEANDIQVLRGVEDTRAFQKGMNNTTTAYDLMIIMEHIARGDIISKDACEGMLNILFEQHFKDKIAGKLPADVRVASKSGSIDRIMHDSGIVFLPDGKRYVVVLLSRGIADETVSTATLANVSRIVYDHLVPVNK